MADGYARHVGQDRRAAASPNVGLPNGLTQLVNAYKDRIPLLMVIAASAPEQSGRDGPQDYEHQETDDAADDEMVVAGASPAAGIPEIDAARAEVRLDRRPAARYSSRFPTTILRERATADDHRPIAFRRADEDPRPTAATSNKSRSMLLEAKNPLLSVGDEITTCRRGE